MTEIQRARLLAAAFDAVEELGYERTSVAEVISRARVSRKTFYGTFASREACFLAVLEETVAKAAILTGGVRCDGRHWRAGIRSAVGTLLVLMERKPVLARLWILEAPKGGESVLAWRARVLKRLATLIAEGRSTTRAGRRVPDVTAESVVGGVLQVLHTRLLRSSDEPFTDLLGPLMYMIVLPYRGERVAREELHNSSPQVAVPESAPLGNGGPLAGLSMRLTYRTVRVLVAIDRKPGASNREVADVAGIVDQGQISRLLGRLAALGLIANHGLGRDKGAANAWQLTKRGVQIVSATQPLTNSLI